MRLPIRVVILTVLAVEAAPLASLFKAHSKVKKGLEEVPVDSGLVARRMWTDWIGSHSDHAAAQIEPLQPEAEPSFPESWPEHANASSSGYCKAPGNPCSTLSRAASAVAKALENADTDLETRHDSGDVSTAAAFAPEEHKFVATRRTTARELIERLVDDASSPPPFGIHKRDKKGGGGNGGGNNNNNNNEIGKKPFGSFIAKKPTPSFLGKKHSKKPHPNFNDWDNGWQGRCGAPGTPCVDKRALGRNCAAVGSMCDRLARAGSEFHAVKRSAAQANAVRDPKARYALCNNNRSSSRGQECSEDTWAHGLASLRGDEKAADAEKACFADDGECTLAHRQLEAVEKRVAEAMDFLAGS